MFYSIMNGAKLGFKMLLLGFILFKANRYWQDYQDFLIKREVMHGILMEECMKAHACGDDCRSI